MKILILGGFLGSGKTSLLLQLAYYITGRSAHDPEYKVVIWKMKWGKRVLMTNCCGGTGTGWKIFFPGVPAVPCPENSSQQSTTFRNK